MIHGFQASSARTRRLMTGFLICTYAAVIPACADLNGDDPSGREQTSTSNVSVVDGVSAPGAEPPDSEFVDTPMGRFHQSCVHGVGDGANIDATERVTMRDGTLHRFASCKYQPRQRLVATAAAPARIGGHGDGSAPVADGWAEFGAAFASTNSFGYDWINALDGSWQVPAAPHQYTNQIVYLFNALEPLAGNAIIQPVLQYGVSSAGGGNFWSIASWYLSSGGSVFFSTLQRVNAGDTIQGYMTGHDCTSSGVCTWQISTFDGSINTSLNVATSEVFAWAPKGVLEVYRISNCNKLPTEADTGATFSNTHVYMPGPNVSDYNEVTSSMGWYGETDASGCSFGVINTSDGVQLFWD